MTATSVWDDPDLKAGGEYFSFENVGDKISGTVNAVRTHRFDDKVVPQILMTTDSGEERTVTAGQIKLKTELQEQRPEAGDHLSIELSEIEKRSGGKTLKHFKVQIQRGGSSPASTAAPAPSEAKAEIDPAAAAAALANLSDEQKKQLGLA